MATRRSKRIRYTDEPMELKPVADFLPPPEELVGRQPTVKVTLALSKDTVEFFRTRAARHGAKYQKMIRRVLDIYAAHYSQ